MYLLELANKDKPVSVANIKTRSFASGPLSSNKNLSSPYKHHSPNNFF